MGLDEVAGVFFQVLEIEHVVQVAVFVADQVKHHMAVVLVGIDVVENHQGISIKVGRDDLSCLFIDDMKQSLEKKKGSQ